MTEQNAGPGAAAGEAAESRGQMRVLSQFVRDVSFDNVTVKARKNPNGQPQINVQVNVDSANLQNDRYEVSLGVNVKAELEGDVLFECSLSYAGIFVLTNVANDRLQSALAIECPRLLFPFARRIIAELTRDGGFPPLMLDPIDFSSLYRQRMASQPAPETANGGA